MNNPILIEPGVKYFFNETLKNCHKKRHEFNNSLLNMFLFLVFSFLLASILYYCYKTKRTKKKDISNEQGKEYIMNIIENIQKEQKKENGTFITDLPTFENEFNIQMKKYI